MTKLVGDNRHAGPMSDREMNVTVDAYITWCLDRKDVYFMQKLGLIKRNVNKERLK